MGYFSIINDIRILIVLTPILIALSWALINILGVLVQQLRNKKK